ncbi:hypothetical protein PROSTU_03240 [Providencia stuartii ATCC 25827]|uniref:Uncharacterized protein n=1 Tax=Providencia stuartii ATCC 25827 TaxID=471874 RepID=A0AA86YLA3_PROST|nr:hypothetical protein PROSTU_03240 [Providencia stuartii ATCC 25827]
MPRYVSIFSESNRLDYKSEMSLGSIDKPQYSASIGNILLFLGLSV